MEHPIPVEVGALGAEFLLTLRDEIDAGTMTAAMACELCCRIAAAWMIAENVWFWSTESDATLPGPQVRVTCTRELLTRSRNDATL